MFIRKYIILFKPYFIHVVFLLRNKSTPQIYIYSSEGASPLPTPVAPPGGGIAPFQPGLTPYGTYQGICQDGA